MQSAETLKWLRNKNLTIIYKCACKSFAPFPPIKNDANRIWISKEIDNISLIISTCIKCKCFSPSFFIFNCYFLLSILAFFLYFHSIFLSAFSNHNRLPSITNTLLIIGTRPKCFKNTNKIYVMTGSIKKSTTLLNKHKLILTIIITCYEGSFSLNFQDCIWYREDKIK